MSKKNFRKTTCNGANKKETNEKNEAVINQKSIIRGYYKLIRMSSLTNGCSSGTYMDDLERKQKRKKKNADMIINIKQMKGHLYTINKPLGSKF